MKKSFLPFLVLIALSQSVLAQGYVSSNPDSVCPGSTNVVYRIPPASAVPSSTYAWSITGTGSFSQPSGDDSIYVNWPNTLGTDQVRVTETNGAGCTSPQATLDVVRYRPTAVVSGGPFNICAGVAGSISFTVTFTGRAPFSVTYSFSNGGSTIGPFTESNILTKVHTITVPVPGITPSGNYSGTITAASDKGGCTATSITGSLALTITRPAAPTASVTVQPSCATPTGTIVVSPTTSGIQYSIDGSAYQTSGTFSGVNPAAYTVTARDANNCVSLNTSVTVNPAPSSPAAPTASVTVQPSCTVSTGTIVITAPIGGSNTYSIDGTNYGSQTTFSGVAAGPVNVTVRNSSGCTSPATALTVNPQPATPAAPTLTVTQPTCSTATGSVTVSAPTGLGLTYSIDGTNYQAGVDFPNLTPGLKNITVRNSAGCTSSAGSATVNTQPATPATPIIQHKN